MSQPEKGVCPHAETTTLLWLYGDGEDGHADHVAQCASCSSVVEMHSEVVARFGQAKVAREADRLEVLAPANRPFRRLRSTMFLAAGLAVAAAVLAVLGYTSGALDGTANVENQRTVQVVLPPVPAEPDPPSRGEEPTPTPERAAVAVQSAKATPRVPVRREGPVDLPEPRKVAEAARIAMPVQAERFDADLMGLLDDLDALEDDLAIL